MENAVLFAQGFLGLVVGLVFFSFFILDPMVEGVICKCRTVRNSRTVSTSFLFWFHLSHPAGAEGANSSPSVKALRAARGHTATACSLSGTARPSLLPVAAPRKVKLAKQTWGAPREELIPCLKSRDRYFIAILFVTGGRTGVQSICLLHQALVSCTVLQ